jgi:hypothetical protein
MRERTTSRVNGGRLALWWVLWFLQHQSGIFWIDLLCMLHEIVMQTLLRLLASSYRLRYAGDFSRNRVGSNIADPLSLPWWQFVTVPTCCCSCWLFHVLFPRTIVPPYLLIQYPRFTAAGKRKLKN